MPDVAAQDGSRIILPLSVMTISAAMAAAGQLPTPIIGGVTNAKARHCDIPLNNHLKQPTG